MTTIAFDTFSNDLRKSPEEIVSAKFVPRAPNTRIYYQPTCYGDFGVPVRTAEFALKHSGGGMMNEGIRTRTDCTHQMARRITGNAVKTAERFFPPSSFYVSGKIGRDMVRFVQLDRRRDHTQGAEKRNTVGSVNAKVQLGVNNLKLLSNYACYDAGKGYVSGKQRKIKTPEISCYENRKTMYQFGKEMSLVVGKTVARPLTGGVKRKPERKKRDQLAVIKVEVPRGRIGTAQVSRRTIMMNTAANQKRVSTPQTIYERRPDSRYNSATLFAGLDHGRSKSPEYNVPILEIVWLNA
jgi:hypothetical protein